MKTTYDFAHILANNLRVLRKRRNLSQLDLALKANLSQTFVNNIENEKKQVSLSTLGALCDALDVFPFQLFMTENVPGFETGYEALMDKQNLVTEISELLSRYQNKEDS